MKVERDNEVRVMVPMGLEFRDKLNQIAKFYQRGQRDQIEFLINKEWRAINVKKIKRVIPF